MFFPGMPSAIQSATMEPLQANLDDNILPSTTSKFQVFKYIIIVCLIW